MSNLKRVCLTAAAISILPGAAWSQSVISAKAGLVHYSEGKVYVGDKEVAPKNGDFPEMKAGDVLRTGEGRAEILLTPGVFLRVAEDSSFRLVANKLEDIKLEIVKGSVLIEAGEVSKYNSIVVTVGEASIHIAKRGLFRIEAEPGSLRVHDGEAVVSASGQTLTVKEGKQTPLSGVLLASKFNKEVGDAFHRWASRRAGDLAAVNLSAAKSIYDTGRGWRQSGWFFNPYFGFFTYIPAYGNYFSPFGYQYYTPRRIEALYYRPTPSFDQNSAAWSGSSIRQTADSYGRSSAATYSGSVSSAPAPAPSAAPAAPAGGPRSGDSGGGSRNSGGGR